MASIYLYNEFTEEFIDNKFIDNKFIYNKFTDEEFIRFNLPRILFIKCRLILLDN